MIPKHTGRKRKIYGWEQDALELFHRPSKPSLEAVTFQLQGAGFENATESRLRTFFRSLPKGMQEESIKRVGKHFHKLNKESYVERTMDTIGVGDVYQGDGHTIDTYIAHPSTGKAWRPEITVWIDVKSRYIAGWYLSEAESALSTLFSLSHAMLSHDHVPAYLHIDNGSGFKNRMLNDESVGFYQRFDMATMFSIPGNPKGKSQIERFFLTYKNLFEKFNDGYCGDDNAPETNRRLMIEVRQGKRQLMSLSEYTQGMNHFIDRYNHRKHRGIGGATPASLWANLQHVPVVSDAAALIRPQAMAKVIRGAVTLDKRKYRSPELFIHNGIKAVIEYDLHDDSEVTIRDEKQRFICTAQLVGKKDYMPESRIDEAKVKRLQGQKKRLDIKRQEVEDRSREVLELDQQYPGMNALEHQRNASLGLDEQDANFFEDAFIDVDVDEKSPGITLLDNEE